MFRGGVMQLEVNVKRKFFRQRDGTIRDIFKDLCLTLPKGQTGAILGPSGTGKTTLLRIIAQIDRSFEGSVSLPTASDQPKIGMVFQEPRLLPWCNVEQNIRLVQPDFSSKAFSHLLEMLSLEHHSGHFPAELSLGLARRVALARALAIAPDILILDEPFASLDDELRMRLRQKITEIIAETGVTTLLVTHDLADAQDLADRIFWLSGSPAHLQMTENSARSRA